MQLIRQSVGERNMNATVGTHHDVERFIILEFLCQVDVDLNAALGILIFNGLQKRVEPFRRAKVTNDPNEIDLHERGGHRGERSVNTRRWFSNDRDSTNLRQTGWLRIVEVVHAVPDGLQDPAHDAEYNDQRRTQTQHGVKNKRH